jgi:hypothetical protein
MYCPLDCTLEYTLVYTLIRTLKITAFLFFAYSQLAHMLRVKTVVLWPFFERLEIDAHVILFVVYPKQKTLVCFDSLIGDGKSATSLRVLVLNVIRNVLQLDSTNDWTDYNVTCPQQNGKNAVLPY